MKPRILDEERLAAAMEAIGSGRELTEEETLRYSLDIYESVDLSSLSEEERRRHEGAIRELLALARRLGEGADALEQCAERIEALLKAVEVN